MKETKPYVPQLPILLCIYLLQIITLKDEVEGFKKHIGTLEDSLDQKTAQIFHLQRLTAEHEVCGYGMQMKEQNY